MGPTRTCKLTAHLREGKEEKKKKKKRRKKKRKKKKEVEGKDYFKDLPAHAGPTYVLGSTLPNILYELITD